MAMTKVYDKFEAPIEVCSVESAELIKYASNSFLATKISFVNWLAQMSEYYGADIVEVTKGMGSDHRIGHEFLNAGVGYGGSCFPKDVSAAIYMSDQAFIDSGILTSVRDINREMPKLYMRLLEEELYGLQGRNITVWGLAFKPGTDDTRDSQAVKFINLLLEKDASVTVYDPVAKIDTGDKVLYLRVQCVAGQGEVTPNSELSNDIVRLMEDYHRQFEEERTYTLEEFRKYVLSQDSLGDVMYFLTEENVNRANVEEATEETEE
jgi:UDPglucose 6-dehydrogenase